MVKRSGLGKGLSALIPEELNEDENKSIISMNLIKPNSKQPRKIFDEEKLSSLAESIKEHGIIQPIVVKSVNNGYMIIAGERRWRAAKLAGLKEVPVIVMDLTDKQVLEISLIENIQREDLNPIEEALAYRRLTQEFNLKQEELSLRIGKSRVAISNTLRLLNLDDRVQDYLKEGVITEGHGRALLAIVNKNLQYELSQKIIDEELTVRDIEKIIKDINKDNTIVEVNKPINPYYNEIKEKLQNYFDTKVNINFKKNNKGKIEIEYYSEEDLQRILDMMKIESK
ncbi:ParB/RepB/Spo0J family partition protein [Clostridium algidicarnis]|uniref:ParB/RepB/Spo0J family partition protein n=1 Tax=Clostridium algidicarnis TaxID=37659 RepID=UPI001C0C95A0|nr:ParB/RepB/Spo0J family partition protein [Clostridium algidicarnis]MBU3210227.1 ParB/RepB/Spo0J family partition protein [Clostridium algidicarnis]MBU3228702.1 ParB/RepB/Spo0J family partition protein [Clostridium algidicarnis]MBU3251252.1 ParB/RepB/Spo0J family partition protein [Clostridium algidicarnis]